MGQKSKTILMLEKKQGDLNDILGVLEKHGFNILTGVSVKDGIDLFIRKHVDLVFVSSEITGSAGGYLAYFIKERTPNVPVFIITEPGEDPSVEDYERQCIDSYISKPFALESIFSTIEKYIK